LNHCSGGASAV